MLSEISQTQKVKIMYFSHMHNPDFKNRKRNRREIIG
jgi:hypothetical protein